MDDRLVLVKCITLLYRESLITEKTDNSSDLVRTILEEIKLPEYNLSINHDRDLLSSLKDTALYMCSNSIDYVYEKEELLQRLKVNCAADNKLYEAFEQGISKDMDEGSLKRTILNIRKFINDVFRENEIVKIVKDASVSVNFNREKIKSIRAFVTELCSKLEPYQIEANRKDPAIIGAVDIGDETSLTEAYKDVAEMANNTSVMRTGWQGINTMLQGGFHRGGFTVIGALQHKFKTGFSLTLFKQIALYNEPCLINPAKKPCLVRISFEDSLQLNLQFLYQNLYENEHKKKANVKDVTPEFMASYVKEKLGATGFQIKMLRVNPSEWTYKDIQNYILELEANGYEVHMLMLDYLSMIPTTGCTVGPAGTDIRDLFRRIRNFCAQRSIAVVTPHQMSSEAKQLIRDGHQDFVKQVAEKGYWDGSKRLDQEVDREIYINIEKLNGLSYLTVQRGKDRLPTIIPDSHKYVVYQFEEVGTIPDDINCPATHRKKIGGGPVGSGEETPFFAFDDAGI
jgi:hypothetical protein